ncbi:hypothetical protein WN943_004970 [Citrus x changshan-huyou]
MTKLFLVSYLLFSGSLPLLSSHWIVSFDRSIDPYCVFEDQSYLSGWEMWLISSCFIILIGSVDDVN